LPELSPVVLRVKYTSTSSQTVVSEALVLPKTLPSSSASSATECAFARAAAKLLRRFGVGCHMSCSDDMYTAENESLRVHSVCSNSSAVLCSSGGSHHVAAAIDVFSLVEQFASIGTSAYGDVNIYIS